MVHVTLITNIHAVTSVNILYTGLPKEFIPHYDPSHYPNSSSCPNQTVIPSSSTSLNTKPSKDAMILIIIGPLSICIVLVLILAG